MFNKSAFNVSAFNADDEGDEDIPDALSDGLVVEDVWDAEVATVDAEPLADGFSVADTAAAVSITRLLEAASLGDGLPTPAIVTPLREAFRVSTLAFGRTNYTVRMVDAIRVAARARPILSAAVVEIARLTDNPSAQALLTAALAESLVAAGVVTAKRDAIAHIALAMALSEQTKVYNAAALVDELLTNDAFAAKLLAKAALVDSLMLVADVLAARVVMVAMPEGMLVADEATGRASYSAAINEVAEFEFEIILGGEVYQGWAVNTETGAPTEYQNYPFNSMCRLGQRYFGAAEDGLYLLDGSNDDGDPIRARILTGEMDFDSPNLKRVERAYMGYTTRGDLVLKVIVTHAGKHTEYWYQASALTSGERTETRVKIGEGIVSRYWQFELVNSDGADFEIDRLDIDVRDLKRRV